MLLFIRDRRLIVKGRVPTVRVIPALNELKNRHPCLGSRFETLTPRVSSHSNIAQPPLYRINALKETTLDKKKRNLLKVSIPDAERLETEQTISDLMGRDTSARFNFIMQHAGEVEELDV